MNIYDILNELHIVYEEVSHKAVFSSEESQHIKELIKGVGVKNIFLTDHKGHYYLYLFDDMKRANIKNVSKEASAGHFSFTSPDELKEILKLDLGSVTPLGIINDKDNVVTIIIDEDLKGKRLLMHPDTNTKTLALSYDDLIKFIEYEHHQYLLIKN